VGEGGGQGVQLVQREITKIGISQPTSRMLHHTGLPWSLVTLVHPQLTGWNALRPEYYPKHFEYSRFSF